MNDSIPPTDILICQLQPDILHQDDPDPDVVVVVTVLPHLFVSKHIDYIQRLVSDVSQPSSYEGAVTEHLRMSGIYWSLTALHILLPSVSHVNHMMNVSRTNDVDVVDDNTNTNTNNITNTNNNSKSTVTLNDETILDWVWTCYDPTTGSFGGNTGQDGHILYTLSALQIIIISTTTTTTTTTITATTKDTRLFEHRDEIIQFLQQLQQPDGSFVGDISDCGGEVDTRFTYCVFQSLVLLNAFHTDIINIPLAVQYVLSCRNLSDGGFGSCIGAESHAGQVFCCIGALAIAQALDQLYPPPPPQDHNKDEDETPEDVLGWWLCERQVDSGGLNGRPEKQADVCYSWWILSSLSILGKVSWINTNKLANYILKCQDTVDGGIADRPDDMADVFHTFFGIAGLSLLGHLHRADQVMTSESATTTTTTTTNTNPNRTLFRSIDPIYALPTDICQQLQLPGQVMVARPRTNDHHSLATPIVDARLKHYNVYYYD